MKQELKAAIHRCKCPDNHLFIASLIAFIVFLLSELGSRIYDLYFSFPLIDIPNHFFAGIALFFGLYWVVSQTKIIRKKSVAVLGTFLISIAWEVLEKLEETVVQSPDYLRDFFFWDGVGDITVAVIGSLVGIYLYHSLKKNTKLFERHHEI